MDTIRSESRTIAIVGGGFAGTTLARRLQPRLPPGWRLVLVSEESYTTFNPMLPEVVGAAVFPEHVVAPIREMLRQGATSQFVMGRVSSVDTERRCVRADTLAGVRTIAYDQLVLAFGVRAKLDLIAGFEQHALPLKLVGDAMAIRNRVLQRVARIELEDDPKLRRRLGHFVVVGGGFSGVEVAGALADFLHDALRWYPRVRGDELTVTVIETGARLLAELPEALGLAAARSLQQRGVTVRLETRAVQVDAEGLVLDSDERIESATVIGTIGTQSNPLVQSLGVPLVRGRIVTAPDMSVPGLAGVWAIGDCAYVPNEAARGRDERAARMHDGAADAPAPCAPPTAQFAVAQAHALMPNLIAAIEGAPTRAFGYTAKGMMATTGHRRGVAQIGRWSFAGLPAWLLWRGYYLLLMPTLGRKLRIWVEWTWSMLFSLDITHLRFTRTDEVDAHPLRAEPVEALSGARPSTSSGRTDRGAGPSTSSGRTEPGSGRTEPGSSRTEPGSGRTVSHL